MSLELKLREDMKQAMKAREAGKTRLSVLRMTISAAKNKEIELRRSLEEEDWLEVISREIKQRRDSIEEYRKVNREDVVRQLEEEIAVLQVYLPEQLSEEKIREIVCQVIAETGAAGKRDMGKVMGSLMPRIKGRADGKLVNGIVSRMLQ